MVVFQNVQETMEKRRTQLKKMLGKEWSILTGDITEVHSNEFICYIMVEFMASKMGEENTHIVLKEKILL